MSPSCYNLAFYCLYNIHIIINTYMCTRLHHLNRNSTKFWFLFFFLFCFYVYFFLLCCFPSSTVLFTAVWHNKCFCVYEFMYDFTEYLTFCCWLLLHVFSLSLFLSISLKRAAHFSFSIKWLFLFFFFRCFLSHLHHFNFFTLSVFFFFFLFLLLSIFAYW